MGKIELSNYNLAELKGLHFEIEKEIKGRQQEELKKAREQILAIAQDLGVSVEDLVGGASGKSKGGTGTKVRPQYKNPADSAQTWSGRGRQPRWMADALASGKILDELKI